VTINIYLNTTLINNHIVKCDQIPLHSRNRDYSLALEGFDFELYKASYSPAVDDYIYVEIDTVLKYFGCIEAVNLNDQTDCYEIKVGHILSKLLNKYKLTYANLHPYITDIGVWTSPLVIDTSEYYDHLICATHGLQNDYPVLLRSVGGDLPSPLNSYTVYYVEVVDGDKFKLCAYPDATTTIALTNGGTGTIQLVEVIDEETLFKQYESDYSNLTITVGNVRLDWLIKCITKLAFPTITFNFNSVDTSTFHSSGGTDYALKDLCMDWNMLYAWGQNKAAHHVLIDTNYSNTQNYWDNQVTLFEVLSELCSMLGFTIMISGTRTAPEFKMIYNFYTSAVGDDYIYGISEKHNIAPSLGYYVTSRYTSDRQEYAVPVTEYDIDETVESSSGQKDQLIEMVSNVKIFCRNKAGGAAIGSIAYPTAVYMDYLTLAYYKKKQYTTSDKIVSIKTDVFNTEYNIFKINLDVAEQVYNIEYEASL